MFNPWRNLKVFPAEIPKFFQGVGMPIELFVIFHHSLAKTIKHKLSNINGCKSITDIQLEKIILIEVVVINMSTWVSCYSKNPLIFNMIFIKLIFGYKTIKKECFCFFYVFYIVAKIKTLHHLPRKIALEVSHKPLVQLWKYFLVIFILFFVLSF